MPDYAKTDLEICQKAAKLAGMNTPQDFAEIGVTESEVGNILYEDVARDALTASDWNFANKEILLTSRLAEASKPSSRYSAGYTMPIEEYGILMPRTVLIGEEPVSYDIFGDKVVLDAGENDSVYLQFLQRVEVQYWPPYFTSYMIFNMAAVYAGAIARSGELANIYEGKAQRQLAHARTRDAQSVTTRGVRLNRFKSVRRGLAR